MELSFKLTYFKYVSSGKQEIQFKNDFWPAWHFDAQINVELEFES